jgi:two-component system cell cycle sensor histidine kinase PleC
VRDQVSVASGLSRSVEGELTRAYAETYVRAWPHHLLLTGALMGGSTLWISGSEAAFPLVFLMSLVFAGGFACHLFRRHDPKMIRLETWRRIFVMSELLQGIGWVVCLVPFFDQTAQADNDGTARSFVFVALVLVMVWVVVLRAAIHTAVIAGLAPLSILAIVGAVNAAGIEEQALALLALGAIFILLFLARRLNRGAAAAVRSRAEMLASQAELEQAKANSSEAWRRAEEADRAKALFLATMSHELRTPLNAILGFSEVMKNEVLGSHSTPSYREYSNDIHGSGQHLLSLINELLELARIEAGHYALREEDVRLVDLIRDVTSAMEARATAKGQAIVPAVDPDLDPVRVDARALRQMIGNLLSNAIKFTAPGGRITVKAGWTSLGGQYVSVADDGPGIPPEEIPLVMSSFGRGTLAVSTAEQGAGLGLPIVKGLAELHGGRFVLKSKLRQGTEAIVILPASRVAGAAPAPARPRDPAAAA